MIVEGGSAFVVGALILFLFAGLPLVSGAIAVAVVGPRSWSALKAPACAAFGVMFLWFAIGQRLPPWIGVGHVMIVMLLAAVATAYLRRRWQRDRVLG